MVISLENEWIWDSWYYRDGDLWHGYFLKADKSLGDPERRHFNVSQGHATSTDLVNWTHCGEMFRPAESPAWDDFTTWTGSVIRDDEGLWHLFYTGTSRAEDGLYQRIGHATSSDGHSWQRIGDGLALDLSGDDYEVELARDHWHDRAMRDPWVMRDPEGDGWLMYFTARADGISEPNAGGAIGFATSSDLETWTLQPPVFVGGFGQLEVPQVFETQGRWYCLFCTAENHWSKSYTEASPIKPVTGNHYLISDNGPRGPWRIAPNTFFDGDLPCRRYAARIVQADDGLKILGFAHQDDEDRFLGYVMDPEPVIVTDDGLLEVQTRFPARARTLKEAKNG